MFKPIDGPDMLQGIFAQIQENVQAGRLKKGDRLPTERAMAASLGVSRTTVREVLKALELMGLVQCIQGDGNYIASNLSTSFAAPLSVMFMLEGGTAAQIQQFRHAMELAAAQGAAACITAAQVAALREICAGHEAARGQSAAAMAEWDRRFHRAIAEASGNPLLVTMVNAAQALIDSQIQDGRRRMVQSGDSFDIINAQHRRLTDALEAHDEAAAVAAIAAHMEYLSGFYAP